MLGWLIGGFVSGLVDLLVDWLIIIDCRLNSRLIDWLWGLLKRWLIKMYLKVLLNLPSFLQLFVLIAYVAYVICSLQDPPNLGLVMSGLQQIFFLFFQIF